MAQRYQDPLARARMAQGLCPECGEKVEQHSTSPNFWERPFDACSLLPQGVRDRIQQYLDDVDVAGLDETFKQAYKEKK